MGIFSGLYLGGWVLFVQPILAACRAFDTGTLTASVVGITFVKCVFASCVGGLIAWLGCIMAAYIWVTGD